MATKEEYVEKLKGQMDDWQGEVNNLEAKASAATGDVRAELEEQIANLKAKFSEGESTLSHVMDVTEDAWEDLKDDAEELFDKLMVDFKSDLEYGVASAENFINKVKSMFDK